VEVDGETGRTRVTRLAACYDVGKAINPQSAEGQIEGGAIQGLGHAMLRSSRRGISRTRTCSTTRSPPRSMPRPSRPSSVRRGPRPPGPRASASGP
jgi:xanthine dehydrogenase molybdopterin-binding subunit B